MYPTLAPGEHVLVDRLAYRGAAPRRGDIVILQVQDGLKSIKRVVGLPGEEVSIQRGHLVVNGTWLNEPYVEDWGDETKTQTWLLKEGQYFLMGDARSLSTDSRITGPVGLKNIKGRAWLVYWPLNRYRILSRPQY
jgi:signal peptidase I